MKRSLLANLVFLVIVAGCREQAPPQALAWEAVPARLTASFERAPSEARDQARAVVSALQSNDVVTASIQLETLCGQPGLTDQQREDATRCWLTVKERLRAAASAGDTRAGEVIQLQRADK